MGLTTFIGLSAAVLLVLCVLFLLLSRWKNAIVALRFHEALRAENNGNAERAIQLYQEALRRGQRLTIGDKHLVGMIERRLKTLQTSTEFVQRFQRQEMIRQAPLPL